MPWSTVFKIGRDSFSPRTTQHVTHFRLEMIISDILTGSLTTTLGESKYDTTLDEK